MSYTEGLVLDRIVFQISTGKGEHPVWFVNDPHTPAPTEKEDPFYMTRPAPPPPVDTDKPIEYRYLEIGAVAEWTGWKRIDPNYGDVVVFGISACVIRDDKPYHTGLLPQNVMAIQIRYHPGIAEKKCHTPKA
jgi:hypothetical protein